MHASARWIPALFLCLSPTLVGQGSGCPEPALTEAWVDPVHGTFGVIGSPQSPFSTITEAIDAISQGPGGPAVVHCLPGIYSSATNGEPFPIRMVNEIHVRGTGAKECVVRGDGTQSGTEIAYPVKNPTGTPNGIISLSFGEVLFDFSAFLVDDTSLEGFTLQGGDVQVYMRNEADSAARISNCVFDLRAGGSQGLYGPSFGILTVAQYHPFLPGEGYADVRWNILNNTFIQGWLRFDGSTEVALEDNVAICNVNHPLDPAVWGPPPNTDPNRTLRGMAEHSIQNNLFRQLPSHPRTAMLGVDLDDVTVVTGTNPGVTNAFAPGAAASENQAYVSLIYSPLPAVAFPPIAKVTIGDGVNDPGFVGEMIGSHLAAHLDDPDIRDWRLLPDSSLVNQGSSPSFNTNPCGGRLTAANGTGYIENPGSPVISFDWDGDGYGNPRTVGGETDIGFDETDLLVVAGSYGNDTKGHWTNGWGIQLPDGNDTKIYVFPSEGGARLLFTDPGLVGLPAWTVPPGTVSPPVQVNIGTLYLDRDILKVGVLQNPTTDTWQNPLGVNLFHTFARSIATDANDLDEYYNVQISFKPTGGDRVLTNLASEIR